MDKIRRGRRGLTSKYDSATKRRAVLEYANGKESMAAVGARYGVSHTCLGRWIEWYERDQHLLTSTAMEQSSTDPCASSESDSPDSSTTPADVKALQEELRRTQVKLACLETLIDITEKDLGIDIRKKAGTKSSAE